MKVTHSITCNSWFTRGEHITTLSPQSSSLPNWSEKGASEIAQSSSHFPQGWVGKHSGRGDRETVRTRCGEENHENLSPGHGMAAAAMNSQKRQLSARLAQLSHQHSIMDGGRNLEAPPRHKGLKAVKGCWGRGYTSQRGCPYQVIQLHPCPWHTHRYTWTHALTHACAPQKDIEVEGGFIGKKKEFGKIGGGLREDGGRHLIRIHYTCMNLWKISKISLKTEK